MGSEKLDDEKRGCVDLTDHQLAMLESLPIFDTEVEIFLASQYGRYSKVPNLGFMGVNFTRFDGDGFPAGFLTCAYFSGTKVCKLIHGNIDELDRFLAEFPFSVN